MSTLPSNWSPAERKMWLLSRHAPPDMHLITDAEIEMVQGQMRRAMALEVEVTETIKELDAGCYWLNEPTLHDAAAAAVFDARRYERATARALEVMEKMQFTLDAPETYKIFHNVIVFLKEQSAARRDRTAPTPENPNPNPP